MVPRLWPGATIVCLACGPSLTAADAKLVRAAREAGRVRVIAINAAVRLAPWADVRYAYHAIDWCRPEDAGILASFEGLRFAVEPAAAEFGATILHATGTEGLELTEPGAIRHGHNSGFAAVNLAVLLGAARVVLVGYDMQRAGGDPRGALHFYPCAGTVGRGEFATWLRIFQTLPPALEAVGVTVVNASRVTALEVFPRVELEAALAA